MDYVQYSAGRLMFYISYLVDMRDIEFNKFDVGFSSFSML